MKSKTIITAGAAALALWWLSGAFAQSGEVNTVAGGKYASVSATGNSTASNPNEIPVETEQEDGNEYVAHYPGAEYNEADNTVAKILGVDADGNPKFGLWLDYSKMPAYEEPRDWYNEGLDDSHIPWEAGSSPANPYGLPTAPLAPTGRM
ncbi:hypothetical protein ACFLYS_01745 [Chloroflexota bacterium]